jgi:hypothetical protein
MTETPKFYSEIKNRVRKATIINQAGLNKVLDVYEEYGEDKVTRHVILTMVYYAVLQEVHKAFKKRGHVPLN